MSLVNDGSGNMVMPVGPMNGAVGNPTATPTPLINVVDGSLSIRRSA